MRMKEKMVLKEAIFSEVEKEDMGKWDIKAWW